MTISQKLMAAIIDTPEIWSWA